MCPKAFVVRPDGVGQRTEDGGQRIKDGRQRTDRVILGWDGGGNTEVRQGDSGVGRRREDGGQTGVILG